MHQSCVDELLTTTRAVRRRLDTSRPVAEDDLRECLRIALQAPNASNRQQWRFVVVTDRAVIEELGRLYREVFDAYYRPKVDAARREGPAVDPAVFGSAEHLANIMGQLPAMLVPCMPGRAEHLDTAHAQAGRYGSILPATWSFMLAARARGLGTCWTTMHLEREREAADVLGIPFDHFTQTGLVTIAHTDGGNFRPARRGPLNEVVHWDRWPDGS